ncbi:MAG: YsnF/AvaK domain-containing protein [Microvirga sp.]
MATQTITAFFDHYEDAAAAVRKLEAAGISNSDLSLVAGDKEKRYSQEAYRTFDAAEGHDRNATRDRHDAGDGAGTGATVGTLAGGGAGLLAGLGMLAIPGLGPVVAAGWLVSTLVGSGAGAALGGLAGSLVNAGVDEGDAHAYAEGINRGGALVTVRASDAQRDQVFDILDDEGTVEIDDRAAAWRSEGWTGAAAPTAASPATSTSVAPGNKSAAVPEMLSASTSRDQTAIPIVEEQLRVGKRDVSHGRVRVRSYVVETPVSGHVTLRDETVQLETRPVDRIPAGDENLFRDRTIEAEERHEEAVVSKEARVKEELVIRKDIEERQETVRDTVRRTEVDVDDERTDRTPVQGRVANPTRHRGDS